MARKPTELGHELEAEIRARTERGESAEVIHAALKPPCSVKTIARRQTQYRAQPAPKPVSDPSPKPETEDVPEVIPDDTPLELAKRWYARVEAGAAKAEKAGNLPALASLSMRANSLIALIHKATPLPKPDPNDDPDMRALADQAEKRLFALVDELFASPGSV